MGYNIAQKLIRRRRSMAKSCAGAFCIFRPPSLWKSIAWKAYGGNGKNGVAKRRK